MDARQWAEQHTGSAHSQYGEDGLLRAIFDELGSASGYCVEFGASDGVSNSNTNQFIQRGWRGLLIEPGPKFALLTAATRGFPGVTCVQSFVTLTGDTTLDRLLAQADAPTEPDLVSIDVDGIDYHIWASITEYSPKVVVIEFNPTIPNSVEYVQPPNGSIARGSSIRSLIKLATSRSYELVAVTENNAIFVRADLFSKLDIDNNDLESLRDDRATTTIVFQGYDGTLMLAGNKRLLWHRLPLDIEKMQVLPRRLRVYPPRLTPVRRVLLHARSLLYIRRGSTSNGNSDDARYHRAALRHVPTWLARRIRASW